VRGFSVVGGGENDSGRLENRNFKSGFALFFLKKSLVDHFCLAEEIPLSGGGRVQYFHLVSETRTTWKPSPGPAATTP
jgi:hypothetical protein